MSWFFSSTHSFLILRQTSISFCNLLSRYWIILPSRRQTIFRFAPLTFISSIFLFLFRLFVFNFFFFLYLLILFLTNIGIFILINLNMWIYIIIINLRVFNFIPFLPFLVFLCFVCYFRFFLLRGHEEFML